jgi:hypothetical protein
MLFAVALSAGLHARLYAVARSVGLHAMLYAVARSAGLHAMLYAVARSVGLHAMLFAVALSVGLYAVTDFASFPLPKKTRSETLRAKRKSHTLPYTLAKREQLHEYSWPSHTRKR